MLLNDPYEIAIHEAGHACMSILLKRGLDYVTIKSTKENPAHCTHTPLNAKVSKAILERECLCDYAGMVAEKIILGYPDYCDTGLLLYSFSDRMNAQVLVERFYGIEYEDEDEWGFDNPIVLSYTGRILSKADAMFSDSLVKRQIKAVADTLLDKQRISGAKVRSIMKSVA